jgi:hypothetical protein
MTLDDLKTVAPYIFYAVVPHAVTFTIGFLAKPSWRKARAAFVLMCRAVVAHEDGDDKTALKDVVQAVQLVPSPLAEAVHTEEHGIQSPPPEPRVAPPGTVPEWPKR